MLLLSSANYTFFHAHVCDNGGTGSLLCSLAIAMKTNYYFLTFWPNFDEFHIDGMLSICSRWLTIPYLQTFISAEYVKKKK